MVEGALPRSNLQNVNCRGKTGEGRLEHHVVAPSDQRGDEDLLSFSSVDPSFCDELLTHPDRPQEAGLGTPEHNVRVVHREHRRMVGETEDESAVNQAVVIGRHLGRRYESDLRPALSERERSATETSIEECVGAGIHLFFPEVGIAVIRG